MFLNRLWEQTAISAQGARQWHEHETESSHAKVVACGFEISQILDPRAGPKWELPTVGATRQALPQHGLPQAPQLAAASWMPEPARRVTTSRPGVVHAHLGKQAVQWYQ